MSEHLVEISGLVHRLHGMGEKLEEHWIVAILLSSLPNSYNPLITALEGHPEADMKMDYVKGKLLDEWRRRCENDAENDDIALRVSARRQEGISVRKVCFYCQEEGHFRRDCPRLADTRRAQEESRRKEESVSPGTGGGSRWNHVCFTTATRYDRVFNGWMVDSGSTRHMTGDLRKLKNVKQCREVVSLADGRDVPVQATGKCEFTGCNENGERMVVTVKDVLFVPGLTSNVLSVSCMIDEGYEVSFDAGGCRILKGDNAVLVAERRGSLFFVKQSNV